MKAKKTIDGFTWIAVVRNLTIVALFGKFCKISFHFVNFKTLSASAAMGLF